MELRERGVLQLSGRWHSSLAFTLKKLSRFDIGGLQKMKHSPHHVGASFEGTLTISGYARNLTEHWGFSSLRGTLSVCLPHLGHRMLDMLTKPHILDCNKCSAAGPLFGPWCSLVPQYQSQNLWSTAPVGGNLEDRFPLREALCHATSDQHILRSESGLLNGILF